MEAHRNFYTLKGYSLLENKKITYSMEDYLEMIYRLSQSSQEIHVNQLAQALNVKPSSASKMVCNLKNLQLITSQKYGIITMTEKGTQLGTYLLYRHNLLHLFFCFLNHSQDELEQVEKVEHFISPHTVRNIYLFLEEQHLLPAYMKWPIWSP